jgi:16S rRNA processing protein RimM
MAVGFDLIETGKIINTHGIKGEVRIQPWADSPAFLTSV